MSNIINTQQMPQEVIELLMQQFLVSPEKLTTLSSELSHLCEYSHTRPAIEHLINHCAKLVRAETIGETEIDFTDTFVRMVRDYLDGRLERMIGACKEQISQERLVFDAMTFRPLMQTLQELQDSKRRSFLLRSLRCNPYLIRSVDILQSDRAPEFSYTRWRSGLRDFCKYVFTEVGDLNSMLILLNTLLSAIHMGIDSEGDEPLFTPDEAQSVPKSAIFSREEYHHLVAAKAECERLTDYISSPHIVLHCGNPGKLSSLEAQGRAVGVVGGLAVTPQKRNTDTEPVDGSDSRDCSKKGLESIAYYEVTLKGDCNDGVRLGWAVNGSLQGEDLSLPGDNQYSWTFDGFSGCYYHNARAVKSARDAESQAQRKEQMNMAWEDSSREQPSSSNSLEETSSSQSAAGGGKLTGSNYDGDVEKEGDLFSSLFAEMSSQPKQQQSTGSTGSAHTGSPRLRGDSAVSASSETGSESAAVQSSDDIGGSGNAVAEAISAVSALLETSTAATSTPPPAPAPAPASAPAPTSTSTHAATVPPNLASPSAGMRGISTFFLQDNPRLKSFMRMIRVGLDIETIRGMMEKEGMSEEEIEGFLEICKTASDKGERVSGGGSKSSPKEVINDLLQKSGGQFESLWKESRKRAYQEGGDALYDDSVAEAMGEKFQWSAGSIVGCSVNTLSGALNFYINGVLIGSRTIKCLHGSDGNMELANLIRSNGLCPSFSSTPASGLEINIGQAPFVYPNAVRAPCEPSSDESRADSSSSSSSNGGNIDESPKEAPSGYESIIALPYRRESGAGNDIYYIISKIQVDFYLRMVTMEIEINASDFNKIDDRRGIASLTVFGHPYRAKIESTEISDETKFKGKLSFDFSSSPTAYLAAPMILEVRLADGLGAVMFDGLLYSTLTSAENLRKQPLRNRAGIPVSLGADGVTYYCARELGMFAIPHSDGRCGPTNGPQCGDCKGMLWSTPLCANKHRMEHFTCIPPSYPGAPMCDICRENNIHTKGRYLYHCRQCGYDLCDMCSARFVLQMKKGGSSKENSEEKCSKLETVDPISTILAAKTFALNIGVGETTDNDEGSTQGNYIIVDSMSTQKISAFTLELHIKIGTPVGPADALYQAGRLTLSSAGTSGESGSQQVDVVVSAAGAIIVLVNDAEVCSAPAGSFSFDKWQHCAIGISQMAASIVIDGNVITINDLKESTTKLAEHFQISQFVLGCMLSKDLKYIPCSIDVCQFRLWSATRTQDQLQLHRGRDSIVGVESGLLSQVSFREGAGKRLHDSASKARSARGRSPILIKGSHRWIELQLKSLAESMQEKVKVEKLGELPSAHSQQSPFYVLDIVHAQMKHVLQVYNDQVKKTEAGEVVSSIPSNVIINRCLVDATAQNIQLINVALGNTLSSLRTQTELKNFHSLEEVALLLLQLANKNLKSCEAGSLRHQLSMSMLDLTCTVIKLLDWAVEAKATAILGEATEFILLATDNYLLNDSLLRSYLFDLFARTCVVLQLMDKNKLGLGLGFPTTEMQDMLSDIRLTRLCAMTKELCAESVATLLTAFCKRFSAVGTMCAILPTSLNPVMYLSTSDLRPLKHSERPQCGDMVTRGPDWIYGDQDGGPSGSGLVIGSVPWMENDVGGVKVCWSNGTVNTYRWGAEDPVNDGGNLKLKKMYDLSILTRQHAAAAGLSVVEESAATGKLKFSTEEIRKLAEMGEKSPSVIEVVDDMFACATSDWLKDNNCSLFYCTETVATVPACEIAELYEECRAYHAVLEKEGTADFVSRAIECSETTSIALMCVQLLQKTAFKTEQDPTVDIVREKCRPALLSFQMTMQGLLQGTLQVNHTINSLTATPIPMPVYDRVVREPFSGTDDSKLEWVWRDGIWCSVGSDGDVVGGDDLLDSSKLVDPLANMTFSTENSSKFVLVGPSGRRAHQKLHRKYTSALGSKEIMPYSGIYRWYSMIEQSGSSRSHCIFGLATKNFNCDGFVGQDRESWGFSTTQDLIHGGFKHRSDYGGRVSVGMVVETILDTDKGTVVFTTAHAKEVLEVAFTGLEGKILVPAWSLYAHGDSIKIVCSSEKSSASLGGDPFLYIDDVPKLPAKLYGTPPPIVLKLCYTLVDSAMLMMTESPHFCTDSLISVSLMQILSSLHRWQSIPMEESKPLYTCLTRFIAHVKTCMSNHGTTAITATSPSPLALPTPGNPDNAASFSRATSAEDMSIISEILSQLLVLTTLVVGKLINKWIVGESVVDNLEIAKEIATTKSQKYLCPSFATASSESKTSTCVDLEMSLKNHIGTKQSTEALQWLKSPLFGRGLATGDADAKVAAVDAILNCKEDSGHYKLIAWLQKHDKSHPSAGKLGGALLSECVNLLFAAGLYHTGSIRAAGSVAGKIGEMDTTACDCLLNTKPPLFLSNAWEAAIKLRAHVRNEVQRQNTDYAAVCSYIAPRLGFLFELSPAMSEQMIENIGSDLLAWVAGLNRDKSRQQALASEMKRVVGFALSFAGDSTSVPHLRAKLAHATRCAMHRIDGFKLTRACLDSLSDDLGWAPRCALLVNFPAAIRHSALISEKPRGLELKHYLYNLDGCSYVARSEIKGSFDSLLAYMVGELSTCNTNGDVYLLLAVLNCVGVLLQEDDHVILSRVNIFYVLHEILESSSSMDDSSMMGETSPTIQNRSQQAVMKAVMKVFTLLALQVASAGQRDLSSLSNALSSGSPRTSQKNTSFSRTRSGPQTLGKTVFDILQMQLEKILTSFRAQDLTASVASVRSAKSTTSVTLAHDNMSMMSEITSLLQCISKNATCQKILVKPQWVADLLELSVFCPMDSKSKALRVFGGILLESDAAVLRQSTELVDTLDRLTSRLNNIVDPNAEHEYEDKDVVERLATFLMRISIPMFNSSVAKFWSIGVPDETGRSAGNLHAIQIQSEMIAVTRSLLSNPKWGYTFNATIEATFAEVLVDNPESRDANAVSALDEKAAAQDMFVSCLAIVGGHIDAIYETSPVFIQDVHGSYKEFGVITETSGYFDTAQVESISLLEPYNVDPTSGFILDKNVSSIAVEKLCPINRFPSTNLSLPVSVLIQLVRIYDTFSARLPDPGADTGPPVDKCPEPNTSTPAFDAYLLSFLSAKAVACIVADTASMDIIYDYLAGDTGFNSFAYFNRLLAKSVAITRSGGISDVGMFEEYISAMMIHKQRLQIVHEKEKEAKTVPEAGVSTPEKEAKDGDAGGKAADSCTPTAQSDVKSEGPKMEAVDELATKAQEETAASRPDSVADEVPDAKRDSTMSPPVPDDAAMNVTIDETKVSLPPQPPSTASEEGGLRDEAKASLNVEGENSFGGASGTSAISAVTSDGEENSSMRAPEGFQNLFEGGTTTDSSQADAEAANMAASEAALDAESMNDNYISDRNNMLESLMGMGFPRNWCEISLDLFGDFNEALNYILSHSSELDRMDAETSAGAPRSNSTFSNAAASSEEDFYPMDMEAIRDAAREAERGLSEQPTNSSSQMFVEWPHDNMIHDNMIPSSRNDPLGDSLPKMNFTFSPGVKMHQTDHIDAKEFHYDGRKDKFLPIYMEPSVDSERIGSIFPGDDIWAMRELVEEGNPQNSWLMIRVSDYEDESMEYTADIVPEQYQDAYAWTPKYVSSQLVVFDGPSEGPQCPMSSNPADSMAISATYEVLAPSGMAVREGMDASSPEMMTLSVGEQFHVCEEAFNSNGTLCLRLTKPARGWMSKLFGFVKKISDDGKKTSEAERDLTAAPAKPVDDWEALLALEDNLEQCEGSDKYKKEDRLFGSLHGTQYQRVVDTQKWKAKSLQVRRTRVFGNASRVAYFQTLAADSNLNQTFQAAIRLIVTLYSRKVLLALMYRASFRCGLTKGLVACGGSTDNPCIQNPCIQNNFLYRILQSYLANNEMSDEKKEEIASYPHALGVSMSVFSEMIVTFIGLVCYRGDPYYCTQLEKLALSDVLVTAVEKDLLSVDLIIRPAIASMVTVYDGDEPALSRAKESLRKRFLNCLAMHVRTAIESDHNDQLLLDFDYDEDLDTDCVSQPNMHLALWTSRLLLQANSRETTKELFRVWCIGGLRASSMSMKHIAFEMISTIIAEIKNDIEDPYTKDFLKELLDMLPVDRLRILASKRLWYEMEDDPAYSRFLQALLHLLSETQIALGAVSADASAPFSPKKLPRSFSADAHEDAIERLDGVESDTHMQSRPVIQFDSPRSQLQLNSQKDIQGPWTFECWVKRSTEGEIAMQSDTQSKSMPEKDASSKPPPPSSPDRSGKRRMQALESERTQMLEANNNFGGSLSDEDFATLMISRRLMQEESNSAGESQPRSGISVAARFAVSAGIVDPRFVPMLRRGMTSAAAGTNLSEETLSFDQFVHLQRQQNREQSTSISTGISTSFSRQAGPTPSDSVNSSISASAAATPPRPSDSSLTPRPPESSSVTQSPSKDAMASSRAKPQAPVEMKASEPEKKEKKELVKAMTLLSSNNGSIKLQCGGRIFGSEVSDPLQETDPVSEQALCVSLSMRNNTDQCFDCVIPSGKWVHLAFVCRVNPSHAVELYVDGEFKDSIAAKFQLPFATFGSTKSGQTFAGSLGGFRLWSTARTSSEICRDMFVDTDDAKGLVANLRCSEGHGARTVDSVGTLNCCKLLECDWQTQTAPTLLPSKVPSFMLCEPEEQEGLFGQTIGKSAGVIEMTGTFKRFPARGTYGKTALEVTEVIVLGYRIREEGLGTSAGKDQPFDGYLDWTERGIRSRVSGTINSDGAISFAMPRDSVILGPPEAMEEMKNFTFNGVIKDDSFSGIFSFDAVVLCIPPLNPGETALDNSTLAAAIQCKSQPKYTSVFLKDDTKKGKYLATFKAKPLDRTAVDECFRASYDPSLSASGDDAAPEAAAPGAGAISAEEATATDSAAQAQEPATPVVADRTSEAPLAQDADVPASPPAIEGSTEAPASAEASAVSSPIVENMEASQGSVRAISDTDEPAGEIENIEMPETIEKVEDPASLVLDKYGLSAGEGALWVEWDVACSRNSLTFGVCTATAAQRTDFSADSSSVWSYAQNGIVHFAGIRTEKQKFRDGDTIGVQIDANIGLVAFYRNNEFIEEFRDLLNTNEFAAAATQSANFSMLGVRPFVLFTRGGDNVSYKGMKTGEVEISYPANAYPDNRKQLTGRVFNGTINGYCELSFHDKPEVSFGLWREGKKDGAHFNILADENGVEKIQSATLYSEGEEVTVVDDEESLAPDGDENMFDDIHKARSIYKKNHRLVGPQSAGAGGAGGVGAGPAGEGSASAAGDAGSRASIRRMAIIRRDNKDSGRASTVTIRLRDIGGIDIHFKVSTNVKIRKVFDVYANKRGVSLSTLKFTFNDVDVNFDSTPESLDIQDDDIIYVTSEQTVMADNTEAVHKLITTSTAEYVLEVILRNGATVRSGIEIEDNAPVRMLVCGEVVEAFQKSATREGVGRFRISDGWISEKLRGSTEDPVVQVLRHTLLTPQKYKITRVGGAKVRAGPQLDSEDRGFCPEDTIIDVAEKRFVKGDSEGTMRLRVQAPPEWVGWVSDKSHILQPIQDESSQVDPELVAELTRRSNVRRQRMIAATNAKAPSQSALKGPKYPKRQMKLSGTIDASAGTFFLIGGNQRSQGFTTSPDFKTVTCDGRSGGRVLAFGSRGFTRGLHYWEVQVDAANWGSVFIGVAPPEATSWGGYGFLNYRATQAYGNETLYGSYYASGDTVGILLDMDHGTITFFKDGENLGKTVVINMGVAYHNLRRQCANRSSNNVLYPCFGMKSTGDQISLRNCKWVSRRGLSPTALLKHVMDAKSVITHWRGTYFPGQNDELPGELIEEVFKSYRRWRGHNTELVKSRAGIEVPIETSAEAVAKAAKSLAEVFNLRPGSKFRSLYGDGHILGALKNQIWFTLDSGENGAWYWLESELNDLVNCAAVAFESEDGGDDKTTAERTVPAAGLLERSISELSPVLLNIETFSSSLTQSDWTLAEDEVISKMVNDISDLHGMDPHRIPAETLESFRQKKRLLLTRSIVEIQVRYCALCVLNKAAAIALPLVDLGVLDNRLPLINTAFNKVIPASVPFPTSMLNRGMTSTRPMSGIEILDMKRVVFTRTKLTLWERAVTETTTATGAPPDEFERPEDLKEIRINRPEALDSVRAKVQSSFGERLKSSVFGQLMEGMRNWDDRAMRRSFVHVEDAGQKRAFFVKFIGEGVDDHGGPYRAVFQTAVGEDPQKVLDLLVPCANAASETGENRDRVVMNSSMLCATDKLALYNYLGKLLAMSLRHDITVPVTFPPLLWKPLVGEEVTEKDLESIDIHSTASMKSIADGVIPDEDVPDLLIQVLLDSLCLPRHRQTSRVSEVANQVAPLHNFVVSALVRQLVTGNALYGASLRHEDGIENGLGVIGDASMHLGDMTSASPSAPASIPLTRERLLELCAVVKQHKLSMSQNGISQLYKGLAAVVPAELLSLFSSQEIERLFCGNVELNVDMLKKITIYDGVSPSDKHIEYFWEAVTSLTQEERSQLINFCSGRSRLPASTRDITMRFKLTGPPPRSKADPDKYLPIAQTCFFALSVPEYTTAEVCAQKLRYAIGNTQEMDADFAMRNADGWQNLR